MVFILLAINTFSQQSNKDKLKSLFKSESLYVKKEIPEEFYLYYKPFLIDYNHVRKELNSKLQELSMVIGDTLFYMHAIRNPNRFENWGMIWNNQFELGFSWNNANKEFKVYEESIKFLSEFKWDVVEWNKNITDRSYIYTGIAGAPWFVCSKMTIINNKIKTEHACFVMYSKYDAPWIRLKEKKENGYKSEKLLNRFY